MKDKMKDNIVMWYGMGLWTAEMVRHAVDKGILTEAEYQKIMA